MLNSILSSQCFQIAGIPLFLLFIGVLARRLGRRDGDDSPRLNDWAVGTSVLLMAFSAAINDFRNISQTNQNALVNHLEFLVAMIFCVYLSIDHDRYRSWVRDNNGMPTKKKRLWNGIVFHNLGCIFVFGVYQAYKTGAI